ncbi:MAG: Carboxyl-terminal protease [Candidatus Ozemobacter sibiricus]|jgi:carboxyl-terminal processing protease|uniref:Carboxyl-terminal protease n=1 Tax=Candidatus Ozemobacter sibiricus TaxID=2268124 RepID=A0A367ZSI0_9BACT|nr:MAG: Carboxyl-terminal protease [Candidatus Ozemobacter sibiricus]
MKRFIPSLCGFRPVLAVLLVVVLAGSLSATSTNITYFKSLDLIRKVMEIIKSDYVDENTDDQKLIYGAIEGMLKVLDDPYTRFMEPKAFKEMQVETQGEFGGLGIVITIKGRMLTVISPIEDTPAWRAGIKAGDMILKIDGKDVIDIALHDAVKLLRGPEGSKVTISVLREGEKEPKDYTLIREIIKIPSVKYWVIKPNIGYIRLTQFIQTSAEDLEKALLALEKAKVSSIILDLRNNPGGLLTAAVEVGRKFIPKGDIVSIKGRDGEKNTYSSFFQSHPLIPLIVLINEGSASASEIVAGAIKDNKRGLLLGKKTFGKGSVQTVISLNDGSALALTTALYYTPSGINIHKRGIEPDIEVDLPKLSDEERKEIQKQIEEEEKLAKAAEASRTAALAAPADATASGPATATETTPVATSTYQPSGLIEPPDSFTKGSLQEYVINKYDTQMQRAVDILRSADLFLPLLKREN